MSAKIGKKKARGSKTIAIVDVESGSVGAGLALLSSNDAPKLFGETRIIVPLLNTRSAETLAREVEKGIAEAVAHLALVAARVRTHEAIGSQGEIDRVAVFFSPPWAAMHLKGGTADYVEPMRKVVGREIRNKIGVVPTTFFPFGTAAAHGTSLVFGKEDPVVLCIIHGEVSELLGIAGNRVTGRSTVPVGLHTLLRTLVSHAGVSVPEARSFLKLAKAESHPLYEPFVAAQQDVLTRISDAIRDLKEGSEPKGILVSAPEPLGEMFARSFTEHSGLAELFPQGGTVRAFRARHAMPYIAAHAARPDTPLMIESLFIDAKYSGI